MLLRLPCAPPKTLLLTRPGQSFDFPAKAARFRWPEDIHRQAVEPTEPRGLPRKLATLSPHRRRSSSSSECLPKGRGQCVEQSVSRDARFEISNNNPARASLRLPREYRP